MIRAQTGEFKLDDYKLVIHPQLTLSQFKAGDIPIAKTSEPSKTGWTSCWFSGAIERMKAEFTIMFRAEAIQQLFWEMADAEVLSGEELRSHLNRWLLEVIGHPPPYEYEWGFISPAELDAHSGNPSIGITFKSKILDMGFSDVRSFYEFRRAQPSVH
jgi:hypothetical protein